MSAEQRFDVARLLRPRSIAIVGVSPEPGSFGGAVLANLEKFAFRGDIHLVSRTRSEINGRPCLPSIDDLPEGVDVAVLAVPAGGIKEAVAACVRRKVGAGVVYAAGFAEVGDAGRAEQDDIVRLAHAGGMALVGPNCIGLVNFADGVPLTYDPLTPPAPREAPSIAVVAQSGAMSSALRPALQAKGLNVSHVISTGNEASLGAEDFLDHLVDDTRVDAIVVFAEQLRHPQRFIAIARRARAHKKPIVMMHPGRSARARASARTHTGALAGDYAVMETVIRHEAVLLVGSLEELIDTAELLARFPAPPTSGAAIITNSGAFKGFALDFCETIGLDLPKPSPATLDAVKKVLPPFAAIDNPLDTTGQTIKDPWIFTDSAAALLADDGIGSLIVSIVPGGPKQAMAKVDALLPSLTATTKPVVVAVMGDEAPLPAEFAPALRDKGVPCFRSPERVLRAMAHATAYGGRLAAGAVAEEPARVEVTLPRRGTLAEYEGKATLTQLGIPVPRGTLTTSLADAQKVAAGIGYPVVLKAQAAPLDHKTEAGGVILGIADAAALAAAWERLHLNVAAARPDVTLDGVLVEAMATPGIEMVVGGRRDPDWGPVLLVGLGGIWIETLRDVQLMPSPPSRDIVLRALTSLKGFGILQGARGAPAADIEALVDAIMKIGALQAARPEVTEIDINPLIVYPQGKGVLALDVLLVTQPAAENGLSPSS